MAGRNMSELIHGLVQFGIGLVIGGAMFIIAGFLSKWWPHL